MGLWKKSGAARKLQTDYGFESISVQNTEKYSGPPPRQHHSHVSKVVGASSRDTLRSIDSHRKPVGGQPETSNTKRYTWDEWFGLYKIEAGLANDFLTANEAGGSLVDFMDKEPLKEAHGNNICPRTLGRFFGVHFESIID